MVEAAFGLILFLTLLFAMFDFAFPMFLRLGLHYAVREGARYAITGNTMSGMGHDASIKQTVRTHSFGILSPSDDGKITINYFDPSGASTNQNNPGNMVEVGIAGYAVPRVAPIAWSGGDWTLSVSAADKMEPFPLPAPAR